MIRPMPPVLYCLWSRRGSGIRDGLVGKPCSMATWKIRIVSTQSEPWLVWLVAPTSIQSCSISMTSLSLTRMALTLSQAIAESLLGKAAVSSLRHTALRFADCLDLAHWPSSLAQTGATSQGPAMHTTVLIAKRGA